MKDRIKSFVQKLKSNIKRPEMLVLPGQLAFFFVLTIAPIFGLIMTIVGNTRLPIDLLPKISAVIPNFLTGILEMLQGTQSNWNLIIFFVSALILASNGTHSMIIASNTIYGIKNQSYIKRRTKAIIMMISLILLLIFILLLPIFGDTITNIIASRVNDNFLSWGVYIIYKILKYPVIFFCIFFLVKVLYTMAPDKKIKSKNTTYGAIFTSAMWVILTKIYSLYVSIVNYGSIYGGLSQLIVLMWWIYILAYVFVLGMALNASNYQMDKE